MGRRNAIGFAILVALSMTPSDAGWRLANAAKKGKMGGMRVAAAPT
jgi:hypothetical protein